MVLGWTRRILPSFCIKKRIPHCGMDVSGMYTLKRIWMKFMFICFFLILFMPIFFSGYLCLGSDTILRGQYLFENRTIISKGGRFELGFFTPGNSSNYYLGIWYKNIPKQTVVWVANRDYPTYYYPTLQLEKNGDLQLTDAYLDRSITLVSSNVSSNATEAVILDTGNFVLRNGSGTIIWQSFDHPTDTWLPGGKIGFPSISNMESKLVSWMNPNNPSPGGGSLVMGEGKQLAIMRLGSLVTSLRFSDTSNLNSYNYTYIRTEKNYTYIQVLEAEYFVYNVFDESMISRIVIDSIGRLTHFVWSEATQAWDVLWMEPPDACKRYGLCGSNAICNSSATPVCSCLTGFMPRIAHNWDLFGFSAGCVREYRLACTHNGFTKVSNIKLPANHTKVSNIKLPANLEVGGSSKCEYACTQNCSCNAYGYSSEGGCLLYMGFKKLQKVPPTNVLVWLTAC